MLPLRKRPRDPNQLGKPVVDTATGQVDDQAEAKPVHQAPRRSQGRPSPCPGARSRRALTGRQHRGKGTLGRLNRRGGVLGGPSF